MIHQIEKKPLQIILDFGHEIDGQPVKPELPGTLGIYWLVYLPLEDILATLLTVQLIVKIGK